MKRITVIIFASLFILLKGYSQTIEVYEDLRGNKYAAINSKDLPKQRIRVKVLSFITTFNYTSTPRLVKIRILLPIVRATLFIQTGLSGI